MLSQFMFSLLWILYYFSIFGTTSIIYFHSNMFCAFLVCIFVDCCGFYIIFPSLQQLCLYISTLFCFVLYWSVFFQLWFLCYLSMFGTASFISFRSSVVCSFLVYIFHLVFTYAVFSSSFYLWNCFFHIFALLSVLCFFGSYLPRCIFSYYFIIFGTVFFFLIFSF